MTQQESIEKSHTLVKEWFKDHAAECVNFIPTGLKQIIIDWRKPGTGNYAMRFIIIGQYVVVMGDVGEAIYGFGHVLAPEEILTYNWHYFWGKCCASETGRNYKMKIPGLKHTVPNIRAIAHFVGLEMAIRKLLTESELTEIKNAVTHSRHGADRTSSTSN